MIGLFRCRYLHNKYEIGTRYGNILTLFTLFFHYYHKQMFYVLKIAKYSTVSFLAVLEKI
jgi:hypothetical protein